MNNLKQVEKALKDNFNIKPEITVSSGWQADLLKRLHQIKPLQAIQTKFESNIWRFTWITFAVSATAAIILGVYLYSSYPDNYPDYELDNNIYTDLAMID